MIMTDYALEIPEFLLALNPLLINTCTFKAFLDSVYWVRASRSLYLYKLQLFTTKCL